MQDTHCKHTALSPLYHGGWTGSAKIRTRINLCLTTPQPYPHLCSGSPCPGWNELPEDFFFLEVLITWLNKKREDENNPDKYVFVQCFNQSFQAEVQYSNKCQGPAASFLTRVYMAMVIPSRSFLGKHWLRELFTKEIKEVNKQVDFILFPFHFPLSIPLSAVAAFRGPIKSLGPWRLWFHSSLKSHPASHCCAGRRMRPNIQSIAQGFSRCWLSPHLVLRDTLPVLWHVSVAGVWYKDKSTSGGCSKFP